MGDKWRKPRKRHTATYCNKRGGRGDGTANIPSQRPRNICIHICWGGRWKTQREQQTTRRTHCNTLQHTRRTGRRRCRDSLICLCIQIHPGHSRELIHTMIYTTKRRTWRRRCQFSIIPSLTVQPFTPPTRTAQEDLSTVSWRLN